MARPILYYVLTRGGYGRAFRVIGVTSEKGRQVYGRDESDAATHVGELDVIYRFPEGTTLEFAKDASRRADKEADRHVVGITQASAEMSRLRDVRDAAILAAAKGLALDPLRQMTKTDDGNGFYCPSCNRHTPRDFCPKCGAPAPAQ